MANQCVFQEKKMCAVKIHLCPFESTNQANARKVKFDKNFLKRENSTLILEMSLFTSLKLTLTNTNINCSFIEQLFQEQP